MTYKLNVKEKYENGLDDPLYNECADMCRAIGHVSVSTIQRKFKISFYRAASLVRALEGQGFEINKMTKEVIVGALGK